MFIKDELWELAEEAEKLNDTAREEAEQKMNEKFSQVFYEDVDEAIDAAYAAEVPNLTEEELDEYMSQDKLNKYKNNLRVDRDNAAHFNIMGDRKSRDMYQKDVDRRTRRLTQRGNVIDKMLAKKQLVNPNKKNNESEELNETPDRKGQEIARKKSRAEWQAKRDARKAEISKMSPADAEKATLADRAAAKKAHSDMFKNAKAKAKHMLKHVYGIKDESEELDETTMSDEYKKIKARDDEQLNKFNKAIKSKDIHYAKAIANSMDTAVRDRIHPKHNKLLGMKSIDKYPGKKKKSEAEELTEYEPYKSKDQRDKEAAEKRQRDLEKRTADTLSFWNKKPVKKKDESATLAEYMKQRKLDDYKSMQKTREKRATNPLIEPDRQAFNKNRAEHMKKRLGQRQNVIKKMKGAGKLPAD